MLSTTTSHEMAEKVESLARDFSLDITNANPLLIIMAKHQDGEALYHIGKLYYAKETKEDYLKALNWFELACHQKNGDAYCIVGQMHQYGKGVLVNYGKAISYYQHAAELGSGAAKHKLGCMSHYGLGRPSSYSEAFQWYSKAANHNNGDAQSGLGYLYEKGQGVPQNNAFSMYWYQLAERNGNKMASAKVEGFKRDHIKPESPYKVKSLDFNQAELLKSIKTFMVDDSSNQDFTRKLESLLMQRKFKLI